MFGFLVILKILLEETGMSVMVVLEEFEQNTAMLTSQRKFKQFTQEGQKAWLNQFETSKSKT